MSVIDRAVVGPSHCTGGHPLQIVFARVEPAIIEHTDRPPECVNDCCGDPTTLRETERCSVLFPKWIRITGKHRCRIGTRGLWIHTALWHCFQEYAVRRC